MRYVKDKNGNPALPFESIYEVIVRVESKHWEGSNPEKSSMNFYAKGRNEMSEELTKTFMEIEEKLNELISDNRS